MNIEINEYQTLFTFFFALYFAVTITITGKLHPFDTPSMYKWYPRAWLRFLFSIIVLNLCPLLYFWLAFDHLRAAPTLSLGGLLLLFWSSLIGQGIYRVFYGSMLWKVRKKYVFYDRELYKQEHDELPSSFYEDIVDRPSTHRSVLPHVIPGLLWILSAILSLYLIH